MYFLCNKMEMAPVTCNDKPVACSFGDNIGDCLVYSHQPSCLQNGETNIEKNQKGRDPNTQKKKNRIPGSSCFKAELQNITAFSVNIFGKAPRSTGEEFVCR